MAVLLNNAYCVPRDKVKLLFKDFFDLSINGSTLQNYQSCAGSALEEDERYIKSNLLESPIVHCDERGARVQGATFWAHVASNEKYTYIFMHPKRAQKGQGRTDGRKIHTPPLHKVGGTRLLGPHTLLLLNRAQARL